MCKSTPCVGVGCFFICSCIDFTERSLYNVPDTSEVENLAFFNRIARRLRCKNALWAALFLLMAVGCAAFAVVIGTAPDGTPITRIVFTVGGAVLAVLFAFGCFLSARAFWQNAEFTALMARVAALGDTEAIGARLDTLAASPLTKGGELRYDDRLIFYIHDSELFLFETAAVENVRTEAIERRGATAHGVRIHCGSEVLTIRTSERNAPLLTQELKRAVARAKGVDET